MLDGVDSMKWQLICCSYSSVNQFITKRKHAKVFHFETPICEHFANFSLGIDRQVAEPNSCSTRVPSLTPLEIALVRTQTHRRIHSPCLPAICTLATTWKQATTSCSCYNNCSSRPSAQKAYAMLAHWWRLQTDTPVPTGSNCQTGCHSHTLTFLIPTHTQYTLRLGAKSYASSAASSDAHGARTNWN